MSALPSISDFGRWVAVVASAPHNATREAGAIAASNLVVSYARALARLEHRDEYAAMAVALETVRATQGDDAAEAVAQAHGTSMSDVLDDERERAEERDWDGRQDAASDVGESLLGEPR